MPPDPPISLCTSRGSSYKRSVPMLCPSNGDVLATPLIHILFMFTHVWQTIHMLFMFTHVGQIMDEGFP